MPFLCGRGDKIRTCDFYVPNVALYQAEPHLDIKLYGGARDFYVPNGRVDTDRCREEALIPS